MLKYFDLFLFSCPDIPADGKPLIDGLLSRYKIGDPVSANCTSEFSKPAANVSWLINDALVSVLGIENRNSKHVSINLQFSSSIL